MAFMSLVDKERQRVIKQLPLSTALTYYGYNTDYERIRCPFHADNTPSLFWNDEREVYHCFGCGAKGTVVELIKQKEEERNNELDSKELLRFISKTFDVYVGDLDGEVVTKPVAKKVGRVEISKHTQEIKEMERYGRQLIATTPEVKTIGYYLIDRWGWGLETFNVTKEQLIQLLEDTN